MRVRATDKDSSNLLSPLQQLLRLVAAQATDGIDEDNLIEIVMALEKHFGGPEAALEGVKKMILNGIPVIIPIGE